MSTFRTIHNSVDWSVFNVGCDVLRLGMIEMESSAKVAKQSLEYPQIITLGIKVKDQTLLKHIWKHTMEI